MMPAQHPWLRENIRFHDREAREFVFSQLAGKPDAVIFLEWSINLPGVRQELQYQRHYDNWTPAEQTVVRLNLENAEAAGVVGPGDIVDLSTPEAFDEYFSTGGFDRQRCDALGYFETAAPLLRLRAANTRRVLCGKIGPWWPAYCEIIDPISGFPTADQSDGQFFCSVGLLKSGLPGKRSMLDKRRWHHWRITC